MLSALSACYLCICMYVFVCVGLLSCPHFPCRHSARVARWDGVVVPGPQCGASIRCCIRLSPSFADLIRVRIWAPWLSSHVVGYCGIVKDANDTVARVELHTNCKTISVDLGDLRDMCVLMLHSKTHNFILCKYVIESFYIYLIFFSHL